MCFCTAEALSLYLTPPCTQAPFCHLIYRQTLCSWCCHSLVCLHAYKLQCGSFYPGVSLDVMVPCIGVSLHGWVCVCLCGRMAIFWQKSIYISNMLSYTDICLYCPFVRVHTHPDDHMHGFRLRRQPFMPAIALSAECPGSSFPPPLCSSPESHVNPAPQATSGQHSPQKTQMKISYYPKISSAPTYCMTDTKKKLYMCYTKDT